MDIKCLPKNRNEARSVLSKYYYTSKPCKRGHVSIRQTTKWATDRDRIEIRNIYNERDRLIKLTGIKFHVDHIVPLKGGVVCGLHVPSNLQILTASDNIIKSNKFLSGGA